MDRDNHRIADDKTISSKKMVYAVKRPVSLAVIAGVLLLSILVWYWYDSRTIIDRSVLADADFSVYAPKQSPRGYKTLHEETSISSGVLTYIFGSDDNQNRITVTVQEKPSNFDMAAITSSGSINPTSTPKGNLYDLSTAGSSKYLLDAGDSLLFFTSANSISNSEILELVAGLRRVN